MEVTNTADKEAGFVNEKQTGSLRIVKVEKGTAMPLAGATFCLKDENGQVIAEGKTDKDGVIVFEDLPFGNYVYQEVYAPEGYKLDDTEYQFEIGAKTPTVEVTAENEKIPATPSKDVPKTGDTRPMPWLIGGAVLLMLACAGRLLLYIRKHHHEVSIDYLFCRTENREQINTPLSELHLTDEAVELLKSGRINNRLLCEIVTNDKFEQLMTDTEIYIDGHATSTFRTLYESLEEQRQVIVQKYKQADRDFYSQTLLAAEVKEEDFFCHVTHKTWDAILHDIRKAHEHDIDSTPDYSLAKKMGLEIRKAIQSSGDYLGKVWAVIFNMLGMDFYKLSPDEQKTFKKVLSKSPAIKNSPVNFRRKRK